MENSGEGEGKKMRWLAGERYPQKEERTTRETKKGRRVSARDYLGTGCRKGVSKVENQN